MRLERQHDAAAGVALADRVERRRDLRRVMSVVVDDGYWFAVAGRQVDVGDVREPPVDALEARERALDRFVRNADLERDGNGRERVQHVVHARAGSP